jgi:hypothetical protein
MLVAEKRFVLYEDIDGKVHDVDLSLTSNVDLLKFRENLGVPSQVDLDYFPMKSTMVIFWASVNVPELR